RKRIFFLNKRCEVENAQLFSGSGPRDPEDLGLAPDGRTLFIADIGDNEKVRSTVVLWTMPVDGSEPPVLNRLTYPDGKHDAEALLFDGDGTPIIVTRDSGKAGLYSPSGRLRAGTAQGVPMVKRGEVQWPKTTTVNQFLGPLAQLVITGGATAPDGSKVVLRTYADAFEWDVTGGDVIGALTRNRPRFTPLPGEPRGEAITYSPDGATFLTVSEVAEQPPGTRPEIRRYTPSSQIAADPQPQGAARADNRSWFAKLSLQDITYLIAGVGVLGVLLLGAGMFGILRARRATARDDEAADDNRGGLDDGGRAARVPIPGDSFGPLGDDFGASGQPGPDRYPPTHRPSGSAGRAAGAVHGGGPPPGAVYGGQPPLGGTYGSARGGSVYGGGGADGGYGSGPAPDGR
ncbi:MAG TPA: hypothetical protein VHN18_18515, partial [Micromonosporaceae bacterium]|nr:hypothetical protein [Micromonosporaceae bacterium]